MVRRPGWAVRFAGILCLGLLIPGAPRAAEQVDASAKGEQNVGALLHVLDDALQATRQAIWSGYVATAAYGRDARGRAFGEDIDGWVMLRDTIVQLQQLRSEAGREHQAGHDAVARARLASADALLLEQARRANVIGYYWAEKLVIDRQRELWESWLRQVPESVAAESRAKVEPLQAALTHALSPTMTQEALTTLVQTLLDTVNGERGRLAGLVSDQRVAAGIRGLRQERTTPCPQLPAAAADKPAPMDRPLTTVSRPNMAAFYPDDVRQANISGRVLIRLWIGADGCMQRAEVIHSSGVPELDDEALQLPQYMSFLPQIEHGRAIAVQTTMPVNFELLNDTRAAAATEARIGESARDYTKRGSDMLDHGQYDLAIAQFDLAIAKDPNLAMAYADRGMAHAWRRDRDRANQDFDKAFSIDARNWVALHGRGMLAFQAGNYVEAKALFTRAIEIRASDSFALWWRAQAHLSTGDLQNVLADADSMIQLTPVEFRGYPLKALVFRLQGKPDEALAVAERLFSANPWQARACSAAAEIYAAAGKQSEALQAMDQSLRMEASAQGYLTRASYRDKTDVAGSRADIDFALQHDPQSAAAVLALARLQTDAGAFKDAEGTLQAALAKNSGQVDVVLARGIVYARSHQSELAEKDFASVRAAAMNGTAHNHLCWSLATAGVALTEALSECDAALAASPKEAIFLDSRGFVLLRLGRYQEAIGSYDGALARRPTLAMSLYGRGLAKRGAGEATAAEADLRAAMTIDASVRRRFADFGL